MRFPNRSMPGGKGSAIVVPSGGTLPTGPPANGSWFVYEGAYYLYDNGKWFNESGNQAWIPVWFTTSPFQHFHEGVFPNSISGSPWPVWGTGNQAADDPIVLATHIEQMRGVLVMCYMDANTSVSIPIRDHDLGPDGQVIYGDSLLDPSVPPMVCFRYNTNSTSDIVNTPSSTTATWSDQSVGARGIPASDDVQFSVSLTLAKDPQPHWVLNVGHTNNAASSSRTFACWLVGCGAPIDYSGDDWEVGSSSATGHYHIYLPFDLILPGRQNFLEDGSWGGVGARTKFMQRGLFWNEEYVNNNSNAVVYFTDTGATGGGDVFASQVPPCVWVFGDDVLDTDRGATVANMRLSSLGIGFNVDGYLNEDTDPGLGTVGQSIQTPSADEYCAVSLVGTYGASNEWGVNVYNLCNSTNINGNARAPASGSGNRHYVAIAFGVDAAPGTASAGNRYWSKQGAGTTMSTTVLRERALWLARVNLIGGYGVVWWTDDGTSGGSNIFATTDPLCAFAIASDPRQPQTFTIDGHYGPMIRADVTGADGQFMFLTFQSGGVWVTEILMGGLASSGHLSQGDNANRQVYLYGMGLSA